MCLNDEDEDSTNVCDFALSSLTYNHDQEIYAT